VIHRRNVVESYLDPLAAKLQSIRDGNGWRRFLVFAALTKSRKGADYVALFSYFEFRGAVRVIFAEGPRQVVNALTLYSVMRANLIPVGANAATDGHTPVIQFFYNVKILADEHTEQAVILFSMLFTLVIWVFSALSLILSCLFYITFLWHYIPNGDGNLSRYCRRKVDQRLEKIVSVKIQKALRKAEEARKQIEEKAVSLESLTEQDVAMKFKSHTVTVKDLGLLDLPLSRRTTDTSTSSQPAYRPTRQERLAQHPSLIDRPGAPTRTATEVSQASSNGLDSDDRPLLHQVASMGRVPPIRTMSNQSRPPFSNNDKPLPMPGAYDFDRYDESAEDLAMYHMQPVDDDLTLPMANMPLYGMPARPPSADSFYSERGVANGTPTRMHSYKDYTTPPASVMPRALSRQESVSSDYGPTFGTQTLHHHPSVPVQRNPFVRQASNMSYSQTAFGSPAAHRPSPSRMNSSYSRDPFTSPQAYNNDGRSTHITDPTTGYGVPILTHPMPPQRTTTLPVTPTVPEPAWTPPRRVGTAPPSATRAPPPAMEFPFELDAHETEVITPMSRFAYRQTDRDAEQGMGIGKAR